MLAPPLCWGCGGRTRRGEPLCTSCRACLHWLPGEPVWRSGIGIWAPVGYSGPARALVRALKFRGARRVAELMAAQIAAGAPAGLLSGTTLVPVPLHPRRLRSRGFNQAAVLAAALGGRAGLPVVDRLVRSGPALAQAGRHRAERRAGPAGTIEARGRAPSRVLLVDDVVTTGATLAACSAALADSGAAEIRAVAFARTLGR